MKQFIAVIFLIFFITNISAQDQDLPYKGWKETETEHFKIIYEDISINSVIEIIDFCEDVYNSVTSFFNSYPDKIILVIHDRIDTSNGSFYPAPPHINMYVSPPSSPEFGAKIDNWLMFLLTHELTHYVNMTIKKGLFYGLSRVFGESISSIPGGLLPGWAIEGIAVKLESDLTGGGRGNNPFFEMFSKALILEDKLFSWRQAAYSSNNPPLSRIYIAGYIINDYMARTYGNDIFVRIYRAYLDFPLPGFNYYVKKVTGISTKAIFSAMEFELKVKYSRINSVSGRLISPNKESNYYLPVITDQGWIVYRDTADKESALVLIDTESRKETILVKTRLTDYSSFSASRDGNIIVFAALEVNGRHPAGLSAVSDLYIINRAVSGIKKMTLNAHLRQPALSPDGSRLTAIQKSGQYTRLVEIDIKTGLLEILFEKKGSLIFNPNFSSDGKLLLFTVQDSTGRNIFILDNNNKIESPGYNKLGNTYNPFFKDNGNIVFVSDMEGDTSLYELEMSGDRTLTKLFTDPVGIFSGIVNKNSIIYSTYSSRGYTLKSTPYVKLIPVKILDIEQKMETIEEIKTFHQNNLDNYKKYTDMPKLVAFVPIPFHINPIYESSQIFGPGITSYFRSILGKSELFSTFSLDTSVGQPGGTIDFTYNWGPVSLNYSLLQGYLNKSISDNARQTTKQQLIFDIPVFNNLNLGAHTYFGFFSGILYNYTIISNKDFHFFSPDQNSSIAYSNKAYNLNGVSYTYTGRKSSGDTFQPFKINSSTFLYTPFSNNFFKHYAIKNINSINIPSVINHQVLKLATRLTYSEIDNLEYLNNPRGFYISNTNNIELLISAEYLFTISKPDWPILGGLSLQGISGSIHFEKLLFLQDTSLKADENYYTGIELILLGNYINVFESAGIGVSYRIEPDISSFNPENLGIYIFVGTNSFK